MVGHSDDAVDLFFVPSGFVLALRDDRMFTDAARRPFRRFLAHQVARRGVSIYGAPHVSAPALAAGLLCVQFWCWPIDSIDGPVWSISVKAAANLAFPALVAVLLRRSAARSRSRRDCTGSSKGRAGARCSADWNARSARGASPDRRQGAASSARTAGTTRVPNSSIDRASAA